MSSLYSPSEPQFSIFCSKFSLNRSLKENTGVAIEDEMTLSDSEGVVWYCNKSCYYAGKVWYCNKSCYYAG